MIFENYNEENKMYQYNKITSISIIRIWHNMHVDFQDSEGDFHTLFTLDYQEPLKSFGIPIIVEGEDCVVGETGKLLDSDYLESFLVEANSWIDVFNNELKEQL
jgi:hypothetical protein